MSPTPTALLDRRIEVIAGSDGAERNFRRMSDLVAAPFVVLLGAPGMGKSTVFAAAAAADGAPVHKVRRVVTGPGVPTAERLYLDALDEYRSEGDPADKVYALAGAIQAAKAQSWRLSCRSEDWRKAADLGALEIVSDGAPILVAQLLDLERNEAAAILAALGEQDPNAFLRKADTLGATAFTANPLSLRLLHTAVAQSGDWPATRFDLFQAAVSRLAREENDVHRHRRDRRSAADIVRGAGKACLVMLISGARAIWRTSSAPGGGGDVNAFITPHDIGIDADLLADTLDTALFLGEGEAFEPLHRVVAEFLAGQALAEAVMGRPGLAALPLRRAVAMITGDDRKPPTELRGLYAWCAAHLARLGGHDAAETLIHADAFSVVAYGDAAVFGLAARRAMLAGLAADDPYFRASGTGEPSLGGLAGEDLASEFTAILQDREEHSHRLVTVLEALTVGRPVRSLRPLLREIALDPTRPEWLRSRALSAWLNGAEDQDAARRDFFDALGGAPLTRAREVLRAKLAAKLPTNRVSDAEVMGVLRGFRATPDDNTVGNLYALQVKLAAEPRPGLFERPVSEWLETDQSYRTDIEVDSVVDTALAAAIRAATDLSGEMLWRWLRHRRKRRYDNIEAGVLGAVSDWLDAAAGRDVELARAMLQDDDPEDSGPWWLGQTYRGIASRPPPPTLAVELLLEAGLQETNARLKEIAVSLAVRVDTPLETYWDLYARVAAQDDPVALEALSTCALDQWRRDEMVRQSEARAKDAARRAEVAESLTAHLDAIAALERPRALYEGARLYFGEAKQEGAPTGFSRLSEAWGPQIATTVIEACERLAGEGHALLAPASLGAMEAENRNYLVEYATVAGVAQQIGRDGPRGADGAPVSVVLAALRQLGLLRDDARDRIERWAFDRLNADPQAGAAAIVAYAQAALAAGATRLSVFSVLSAREDAGDTVREAVRTLLAETPNATPDLLDDLLILGARLLPPGELAALSAQALSAPALGPAQSTLWRFVAFVLDPVGAEPRLRSLRARRGAVRRLRKYVGSTLYSAFDHLSEDLRQARELAFVELVAPLRPPVPFIDDDEDSDEGEGALVVRDRTASDYIERAIKILSRPKTRPAWVRLRRLAEMPGLDAWRPKLQHAAAEQANIIRDAEFVRPAAEAVREAVAGGPPVNGGDLSAVLLTELDALGRELLNGVGTPWKHYWNTDAYGRPTTPRVENQCRDLLMTRLGDRLARYGVAAVTSEARQAEDTRSDGLIYGGAGRTLPIEVKRHMHPDLWTAAFDQLPDYIATAGSAGRGIYLVFWFGATYASTPARPDGAAIPINATQLSGQLAQDLRDAHVTEVDVVVFDASRPPDAAVTKRRASRVRRSTANG
jgi:hypothetical protein